jgi:hypothetical protein
LYNRLFPIIDLVAVKNLGFAGLFALCRAGIYNERELG